MSHDHPVHHHPLHIFINKRKYELDNPIQTGAGLKQLAGISLQSAQAAAPQSYQSAAKFELSIGHTSGIANAIRGMSQRDLGIEIGNLSFRSLGRR